MSGSGQIAARTSGMSIRTGVDVFHLYGINAAGETAFAEVVPEGDRAALQALAQERLRDWHAVEVWEGPVCLVRVRRRSHAEG
jgi:hypothetical protein